MILIPFVTPEPTSIPITGGTIVAASGNQADVLAALNQVTSSTTVVQIPAGTWTWTSELIWSLPAGNTNLSILGAGSLTTVGGGDATVIIDGCSGINSLINITTGVPSSYFRIAGITIEASSAGAEKQDGTIQIGGFCQNFRFDHNHLNQNSVSGIDITLRLVGCLFGVADHILGDGNIGISIYADSWGGNYNFGDVSWSLPTNWGSSEAFFIEDSVFNAAPQSGQYTSYINDCYLGGRQVIRYNTINNSGIDEHPTGGAERWRGTRSTEIYQNNFIGSTATPTFTGFFCSSGTAMIWGNNFGAAYESIVWLVNARNGWDYAQIATPNGWGYAGTQFNGTGSEWDGNTNVACGYPCIDQPGRGQCDLLNGEDFPNALDSVTGTPTWPHQVLEPIYEWLNQWQPTSYAPSRPKICVEDTTHDSNTFIENREWYQYTLVWNGSAWTGTAFNGTVGTGSGLLANRPTTCTPGVAYWATDTNTLYVCATANTWAPYYTPYVYPHPLNK